jgi:hypothetical protein
MKDVGLRAFVLLVSLLPGVFIGLVVNAALYIFHSTILGSGDGAPEWYCSIQGTIQVAIMATSIITCMILSQYLYRRNTRRRLDRP